MMAKTRGRLPIWLPYTNEIIVKKDKFIFNYKGGVLTIAHKRIQFILFYGAVCPLEEKFLDICVKQNIPICIHRRNVSKSIWIISSPPSSDDDVLTKQIFFRTNKHKSLHVAKKLVKAKIVSMYWCYGNPSMLIFNKLRAAKSIDEVRVIESIHARRYWNKYYQNFGFNSSRRRKDGDSIKTVLDAVSKLTSGIILRWITYHKLSPYHGFLHTPTDYPSLVYDLIEPYRGYIEQRVFQVLTNKNIEESDKKKLLGSVIYAVEELFDEKVYTHQTRQIVTFQELLHGNVLALRSYLMGFSKKFVVPIPGKAIGGRPIKTGYKLYGRSAGPTDFFEEAEKISKDWELKTNPKNNVIIENRL